MYSSKEVKINDEYDNKEFKDVFDNNDKTMILGIYPGVGKTTCVKNYENHNILFIRHIINCARNYKKVDLLL